MEVILNPQKMQQKAYRHKRRGESIALVPTMGALHRAHLELVRRAKSEGTIVIVSIFVNPTQFGKNEDFDRYPRTLESDLRKLEGLEVNYVFVPEAKDMYPEGFETVVSLKRLPKHLCGLSRPGHFDGVATVVLKLFNICMPDTAVFGLKDYQQFKVIQKMVRDLNLPIRLVGVPTIREEDGLAESSRNVYLTAQEREAAPVIYRTLKEMEHRIVKDGVKDPRILIEEAIQKIEAAGGRVDYVSIVDPETLDDLEEIQEKTLLAAAVYFGKARLIDNLLVDLNEEIEEEEDEVR